MTDRLSRDDTSEIVKQARQALLLLLISCAAIFLGTYFQSVDRQERALRDAKAVLALTEKWSQKSMRLQSSEKENYTVHYPNGLGGLKSTPFVQEAVVAVELEANIPGEAAGKDGKTAKHICHSKVGIPANIFSDSKDSKQLLRWGVTDGAIQTLTSPRFKYVFAPKTLEQFATEWDRLFNGNTLSLDKIYVEDSYFHEQGMGGSFAATVSKTLEKTDVSPSGFGKNNTLSFYKSLSFKRENSMLLSGINISMRNSMPEKTAALREKWEKRGYDGFTRLACTINYKADSKTEPRNIYGVLYVPFKLKEQNVDWNRQWIDTVSDNCRIEGKNLCRTEDFVSSFVDLNREAKGLETLDLEALNNWLQNEVDENASGVSVGGIAFSPAALKSLGIIVILLFQSYAAVHLAQVATRIPNTSKGDPGAFMGWVLVYPGWPAQLATIIYLSIAPATVLMLTIRLMERQEFWSSVAVLSIPAVIGSLAVALYCFLKGEKIREGASIHSELKN